MNYLTYYIKKFVKKLKKYSLNFEEMNKYTKYEFVSISFEEAITLGIPTTYVSNMSRYFNDQKLFIVATVSNIRTGINKATIKLTLKDGRIFFTGKQMNSDLFITISLEKLEEFGELYYLHHKVNKKLKSNNAAFKASKTYNKLSERFKLPK